MNGMFKDNLYEQLARVGQGLANGHRLEILDLLCQGERTVDEISRGTRLSLASASQHLQILYQAHLLARRKTGTQVRYRVADRAVVQLWLELRDVAARQVPEVDRLVGAEFGVDPIEPLDQAELEERLALGSVIVIDVRPQVEYLAGHIAGAVSMPLEELEARLGEIPKDREIVAYCRGPYCVFSGQAVARLRQAGFEARRMSLGYPEWSLAGRAVVTGTA